MSSTAKFDGDSYDLARVPTTPDGGVTAKRTIRATLTGTEPTGDITELFATGDDGTLYMFIDQTKTRGFWYKAIGARLDFIVDVTRPLGKRLGRELYDLTADDVLDAPTA